MCGLATAEACARLTGRDPATTTSRPPATPIELGVLAAERRHHPVRRTPLHHWHEAAGATWMDAGLWKRPEHYGNPLAEVRAVRNAVGLIDVSTLGKIELRGPDAAYLLERLAPNRWADLKVGRARYGILCFEDGVLFDDGVGGRLGPDHFYLTATTGNAEAVFQWIEQWRATWHLDATAIEQTAATAAMNLAGPRAREVLQRLTDLDLTSERLPYMGSIEGEIAGVPCRLWRIGFVGELGYEIHCPNDRAGFLWEALVAVGEPFGLVPFGVEAQRVLRLEKGHPILGHDTDALATPLDAGLAGLVRFDKPYFLGQEALRRRREIGSRMCLVGFTLHDRYRVPAEGCQVVAEGRPVGRVTSARYSPTLDRNIGLAWVPTGGTSVGARFVVRCEEADREAIVVPTPFYDREGRRLRV
jgi:sarcosine oxidase subunit alpha